MIMKKIMNSPSTIVDDMIGGMVLAHPSLRILNGTNVIVRKDVPVKGKVGVFSGGGSGHEPAHCGYVGEGMLDGACAGDVFTSPSVDQMMEGIRAVNSGNGVLIIAKNYTGDNLNFDMAAELLATEGIRVAKVVVKDDVAVEESENTTGRRGVAGTVLVHKVVGAKAATGATLDEVRETAQKAIDNVRTFGVAISPCTNPLVGKPGFELSDDEMELGTGIHGEKGIERIPCLDAHKLAVLMTEKILNDHPVNSGESVAVMINGCGATPLMELYVLYQEVYKVLYKKGIKIAHTFVGEYMTSLEMGGASISIMKLDNELKDLILAPANTPALKQ